MEIAIEVRDLVVERGKRRVLHGIDCAVPRGSVVGLLGPSGSGKTTLMRAIVGVQVVAAGRVRVLGRPAGSPELRSRVGYVTQAPSVYGDLTVRENLAVASRRPSLWETAKELVTDSPPSDAAAVDEALELVELGWASDLMPSDLSQGQRKLVGIARAVAMGPRVLCLDEPAAGLDTGESEELGRRLRRLADEGSSMLLIDHDMGLVLSICDHVIVLEFGKVIAQGSPDQVTRDPKVIEAYLGGAGAEVADEVQAAAAHHHDSGTQPQ